MGQLDEAIRAHLELKRRHGASEEELKAKEQEALGPVRREAAMPVAAEPEGPIEPPSDPDAEPDLGMEPDLGVEPDFGAAAFDEPPPEGFHEPLDPLVDSGHEAPLGSADDEEATGLTDEIESVEQGQGGSAASVTTQRGPDDTPARGFDAIEEEPVDEGEDMLEETPDFLQETPEHDRLWFEQKPPRDFDFDE